MINISNFSFLGIYLQERPKFSHIRKEVIEVKSIYIKCWVWFNTLRIKPKQDYQIIQGNCEGTKWKDKSIHEGGPKATSSK